jgi:hypothetical protein
MPEPDKYTPPESSSLDYVHSTAKGLVGMIPTAGSLVAEVFGTILPTPLERRRQQWMENIAQGIRDLEDQSKLTLAHLQNNEQFVSTLLHASQAAQRTHQEEKIEALRNGVLNSALPNAPDEALQQIFLSLVDTFTVWHLRLLRLFDDPVQWFAEHQRPFPAQLMGGLSAVLEAAYPELRGRQEFHDLVWKDLLDRGLVNTNSTHAMMSAQGLKAQRTTEIGKQFLKFIAEPPALSGK